MIDPKTGKTVKPEQLPNANPNTPAQTTTLPYTSQAPANAVPTSQTLGAVNQAAAGVPQPIQMTYTDPTGQRATGYSINNQMYKDAAGTQRIDNGSLVTNASGTQTWVMTDQGGVPYSQYIAQQQQQPNYISEAKDAAMQAANQRLEADILAIEKNRPLYNEQYDALARQNYQGYMTGQQALANQLASQGLYNSGYSDTAKVQQTTSYREQQNQNERSRIQQLAELDNQIAIARLNGSADLNELEARYAQLMQEQANADRAYAWEQTLHEYDVSQDDKAWAWKELLHEYDKQRDAIYDERYDDETAYSRGQDEKSWAWQEKMHEYDVAQDEKAWAWEEKKFDYNAKQDAIDNYYKGLSYSQSKSQSKTDAEKLYEQDPMKYTEVMNIAQSFADNQLPVSTDSKGTPIETEAEARARVMKQLAGYQDWFTQQYGEEYYELYRDTVLSQAPWSPTYSAPEPIQYTYQFDDLAQDFYDRLYYKGGLTNAPVRDEQQAEQIMRAIASLQFGNQISEQTADALLDYLALNDLFDKYLNESWEDSGL
ncbi:MAG: hypothetical protein DBY36_07740 [Clostridiales bacterium]|nr:MAG: hypothetical protein DBY36_07740 [Clostridiales bacterium]